MVLVLDEVGEGLRTGLLTLMAWAVVERRKVSRRTRWRTPVEPRRCGRTISFAVLEDNQFADMEMVVWCQGESSLAAASFVSAEYVSVATKEVCILEVMPKLLLNVCSSLIILPSTL